MEHVDYVMGWICALPIERAAAEVMLDERHEPLPQNPSDANSYTLGRIGVHNIVIASLPAGVTGNNSAATVASHLKYSFPTIGLVLIVGIGGGAPSATNDIRLGDVVISKPTGTYGGVIQYDFGKTVQEGQFVRTGYLNRPPNVLLNAVSALQAKYIVKPPDFTKSLLQMASKYPNMQADATYPGARYDLLFDAQYNHPLGQETCDTCSPLRIVPRRPRSSENPKMHYGLIASGNQVMRDGSTREKLRQEHDVLCFEMEAAGLVDTFPCLVIRGICDYADTHKNKLWQPYAALTAAAYAKELLGVVANVSVARSDQMKERSENIGQRASLRWKVPRVNPLYTGRKELGKSLAAAFSFDAASPPAQQRTFVVIGIGGAGKSELCAKFANDHEEEYWGIFWLDARSVATAEQGLVEIGRYGNVAEPDVTTVKSWLACKNQRWLLIIDNADIPDIDYSQFMPSTRKGDILLTTRNPECAAYETSGRVILDSLEPDLARELLLKACSIPKDDWSEKDAIARCIIKILGSHTLAIIQAGAFVRRKLCSIEEYPKVFQEQKAEVLRFHSKANTSTYGNIYATFEVSAEYLQQSSSIENSDALGLLHILAYMHNSGVTEKLFQRALDYGANLQSRTITDEEAIVMSARQLVNLPGSMRQGWSGSSEVRSRWRKARAVLESLSIITIYDDEGSVAISMHSLVHAWAKERQDFQSQSQSWQSAATLLALSCQGWFTYQPFLVEILSQVRACMSHDVRNLSRSMSDFDVARITFQLAEVLDINRDDNSLISLVPRIRSRLEGSCEIGQAMTERVETLTATQYRRQGNLKGAIQVLQGILKRRTQRLQKDHPDILVLQHKLAMSYIRNEQFSEAIKLLEHIVEVDGRTKAPDNVSRLDSQCTLATAYVSNGQTGRAVKLLEYVIEKERPLAEDNPNRLTSQCELARIYRKTGQTTKAIQLLEHVVAVEGRKLPEDHHHRLASQYGLAQAYKANGQTREAVKLFERVVAGDARMLPEDHSDRLTSQHELALGYQANGQVEEAIKLLEHVVAVQVKKLPQDHRYRLISQEALIAAYTANEQYREARELNQTMKIMRRNLPSTHKWALPPAGKSTAIGN